MATEDKVDADLIVVIIIDDDRPIMAAVDDGRHDRPAIETLDNILF
jgi:hypothetical protein